MTETVAKKAPHEPARRTRSTSTKRRKPRKPIRRALVVTHRWSALILGTVLVIICTTGAALVFAPELVRATNSELFHATPTDTPVGFAAAFKAVHDADPNFGTSYASEQHGVYFVFTDSATSNEMYFVDAGTGKVNGHRDIYGGVIGFLVNVHDCGLTCESYPGYLEWLTTPAPIAGLAPFEGMTWAAVILGGGGLLLLILGISGIVIWWPGFSKWRHGFRVRLGKGRFARDYDLHNVIGIVAAPALLVWALTGMNFEIPAVAKIWYSATGGVAPSDDAYTLETTGHSGPQITLDQAATAATAQFPGAVVTAVSLPSEDENYYSFTVFDAGPHGSNADLWRYNATYHGNRYIGVDAHDVANVKVMTGAPETVSNEIIDDWAQPMLHYGNAVNPWWRILWFGFGISPLLLMLTGLSTWLFRRSTTRKRKIAQAARAAAAPQPT